MLYYYVNPNIFLMQFVEQPQPTYLQTFLIFYFRNRSFFCLSFFPVLESMIYIWKWWTGISRKTIKLTLITISNLIKNPSQCKASNNIYWWVVKVRFTSVVLDLIRNVLSLLLNISSVNLYWSGDKNKKR